MQHTICMYQLPHRQQFIVRMIILRSQQQFELKALGIVVCSLDTYLKVIELHLKKKRTNFFFHTCFATLRSQQSRTICKMYNSFFS